MESRQIISLDESKQIIEAFFRVNFNFNKLLQAHKSNHSKDQIVTHVKKIFRNMILDMEKELMIANKIKTMQFYENKSDELFDSLMNLSLILNEEHVSDFIIYYRNRVSRVTVYQTDLIPSYKRLSIYEAFLRYATENSLFDFCIPEKQYVEKREMVEDPMFLYTGDFLEQLYKLFISENGNLQRIESKIKEKGKYPMEKYVGELLRHNVRNLFLIGLYRMYKAAMRNGMRPSSGWPSFNIKYNSVLDRLDLGMLKLLFRVAVYDDAQTPEIIDMSKAIRRKLIPKVSCEARKQRETIAKKQRFENALKVEMKKLLRQKQQNNSR